MGSVSSIITVEEARPESRLDRTSMIIDPDTRSLVSRSSRTQLQPPELDSQNAYVPYLYARDCLAKVMDDMKRMKISHVKIVHQIEENYKSIEDETQGQFNAFVISLRLHFSTKVNTFKQVIEIHREEFKRHQGYWDETLASLSARNKQLLKDKKRLLIINKVEIERLEKEKEQTITELTHQIDKEHGQYTLATKDYENLKKKYECEIEEKKALDDELEKMKMEIERLELVLQSQPDRSASGDSAVVGTAVTGMATSTTVVKSLDNEERRKYELEIKSSMKELALMKAKYDALMLQFNLVADSVSTDKEKTQETIVVVSSEKDELQEEREKLKQEIKEWEEKFKKEKGREPSEKDKSRAVKKLDEKSEKVEKKISQLDVKIETLNALKEGKVPEPTVVKVPEPVVKTIKVKVPDPELVAALAASEKRNTELQQKIQELENSLKDKDKNIKVLQKDKKKLVKTKSVQNLPVKSWKDDKNSRVLLEAVINQVHDIHGEVKKASKKTSTRLESTEAEKARLIQIRDQTKQDIDAWVDKYVGENGAEPTESDRTAAAQDLYSKFDEYNAQCLNNETDIVALTMMKTGEIPAEFGSLAAATVLVKGIGANAELMKELEDKIQQLEEENNSLNQKNYQLEDRSSDLEDKIEELESELEISKSQVGVGVGVSVAAASVEVGGATLDEDIEGFGEQLAALQRKVDESEAQLREEKAAHGKTKQELEDLKNELERSQDDRSDQSSELEAKFLAKEKALKAELKAKDEDLTESKQRVDELENEKLKKLPVDSAKEIKKLQEKLKKAEADKKASDKIARNKTAECDESKQKVTNLSQSLAKEREINRGHQDKLKVKMSEKDKEMKEMAWQMDKKQTERAAEEKKKMQILEKKLKEFQIIAAAGGKEGKRNEVKVKKLQEQMATMKKQSKEDQEKIRTMEREAKEARVVAAQDKSGKAAEKQIKELDKKLEMEKKKFEREQTKAKKLDEELTTTKKDLSTSQDKTRKLTAELAMLGVAAKEGIAAAEKVAALERDVKKLTAENITLADNWNSERVLRKKYYNMVEDMKGKIRVYCRARPLSNDELARGNVSIIKSPDEYSIEVTSSRGTKEFQYDQVFTADATQEKIFEDTNNLIQSAVDGYNVCIFAYGQTGSGKTFTMIGDSDHKYPGIAPRAFTQIFNLLEQNKKKFSYKVTTYMLELYNDKLIDLYQPANQEQKKLEIKKDKKGMVFVQDSVSQVAINAKELFGLFEEGSHNRHIASTKMNSESSRSHLILGILIETTNRTTGTVTQGKLSLVDLAGSERISKTNAQAEQLKEAQSINKSLSALGDVISALSSGQSFIPYRNNKLTLLMQDSLGGNAKTLMFVNISPADYNADESVISLTYASRVKLITNEASKNADNKEIARLKDIIVKLKHGERIEEEEIA
ncbi:uncharacterized protein LOC100373912 [Saccoglossus kowalevskii]|uniref:Myosin-10-like n=1 Tax=Saccoglossus kowalevskii TaxID=10224 RepID=A0ABM0M1Y9_SACKO|nr:PREDICTED: myosin-10-like [Saccoglossus kowalevskii]